MDTVRWETQEENVPTYRVGSREGYAPSLSPRRPVEQDMAGAGAGGGAGGLVVLDWSVPNGGSHGVMEVMRLGSDGDTLFRLELGFDPVPVPGSVLDSLITPRVSLAPSLGLSEGELERALRQAVTLPDFRPPLRMVHGGSDGTVWVQLNSPSTETADWVLIGDDGSPRGRLTMPVSLPIRHSDLPTVWAVETDDLDVPWLLRLRVEPPG